MHQLVIQEGSSGRGSAVHAVGTAAGVKIIIVQNCGIILKWDKN